MENFDNAQGAAKLLERSRVGALLRVFAFTPDAVAYQTSSALAAVARLLSLRVDGRPMVSRVDLLVSSDPDYDDTDCGKSAERLREVVYTEFPDCNVYVSEVKKGDVYCMLLNYGIAMQMEDRIPYSLILSHRLAPFITEGNIARLLSALKSRARVAGLVLPETKEGIRRGRVLNSFALWHNRSLMTVGGFDLRAAKPALIHAPHREKISGWSDEKARRHGDGVVEYHVAGCEEIIPLIRLVRYFGPSIAPVLPAHTPEGFHEVPESVDPKAYYRHLAKLATKEERQKRFAATEGVDLEFIERGTLDAHDSASFD